MCLYCVCIAIQMLVGNPVVIDMLEAYVGGCNYRKNKKTKHRTNGEYTVWAISFDDCPGGFIIDIEWMELCNRIKAVWSNRGTVKRG